MTTEIMATPSPLITLSPHSATPSGCSPLVGTLLHSFIFLRGFHHSELMNVRAARKLNVIRSGLFNFFFVRLKNDGVRGHDLAKVGRTAE